MAVYYARWEHGNIEDERLPKLTENELKIKSRLMNWWGHVLLDSSMSKALVIMGFCLYLGVSIWGATQLDARQVSFFLSSPSLFSLALPSSLFLGL